MNFGKVKSIFKSKTFWFNLCGLAATFGLPALGIPVPADPATMAGILGIGNVALRTVTKTAVNLLGEN
jgi:hypothetical protein